MSHKELNETLQLIARAPGEFRRDTAMLLNALSRLQEINRKLSFIKNDDFSLCEAQAIYDSEKELS